VMTAAARQYSDQQHCFPTAAAATTVL
jgi:hypothetical protein